MTALFIPPGYCASLWPRHSRWSHGGNFGGCAQVDPSNHIVFFASNNPGAVNFYVYDTTSGPVNIAGTAAGSISITGGPGQISVLSTQSLPR